MHVHVTFYVKSKCIHLVKKTIDRLIFTFFPVFFYSFKVDLQTIINFLRSMKFIFPCKLSQVILKTLQPVKRIKKQLNPVGLIWTYHLLIHDSPSEMTKTKAKQPNSTITITTDWIKHSKYKDWYHSTDLDASICRNDSLVIVLACLYLYTCIYIIKSSTSWSLFFFLFWCSRHQYKLIIFSQIFFYIRSHFHININGSLFYSNCCYIVSINRVDILMSYENIVKKKIKTLPICFIFWQKNYSN